MLGASLRKGPLRRLLDGTPSATLVLSPTGTVTYANQPALELFALPAEPLPPLTLADLLSEIDLAAPRETSQWARATPLVGAPFDASVVVVPLPEGDRQWTVCVVADLTQQLSEQLRLETLNRLYLTLIEVQHAVLRAATPESLFREVCTALVASAGMLGAWVGEPRGDGTVAVAASDGSLEHYISQTAVSVCADDARGRGPMGTALREGRPVYVQDFQGSAAAKPWLGGAIAHGIRAVAVLPLRRRGMPVAALALYSRRLGAFTPELCELLESVAEEVSSALETLATRERLRRYGEQRHVLLARLVEAQEHERSRIAADVHDEPVQTLTAVMLRLGLFEARVAAVAPELLGDVASLTAGVSGAVEQLRSMLFDLSPVHAEVSLEEVLRESADVIAGGAGLRCSVSAVAGLPELPLAVRTKVVRIVKEALRNAVRHANATSVWVRVTGDRDAVIVEVVDDGSGTGQSAWVSAPGHHGLTTMRDRAAATGGICSWQPAPGGRGTLVRLSVPA